MAILTEWHIPFAIYALAFGAVLPLVSLVFPRVLSNVVEGETGDDPALAEAKSTIADLRRQLRESESGRKAAEDAGKAIEARIASAEGILLKLVSDDKRERIHAAHQLWPQLPGVSVALIAGASASYVSEILKTDTPQEKK
jgi:hypothetical protein